jgi:hypothetical protein
MADFERFNSAVKGWTAETHTKLKTALTTAKAVKTGKLRDSLTKKIRTNRDGITSRISYGFERYGVFVEKGVGRGYPATRVTSGSAFAKRGENSTFKGRYPKPWFNETILAQMPELADEAAKEYADVTAERILIQ